MKLIRWTQFTWDLAKLPSVETKLEAHYAIRPATAEERKTVHHTILSAFALDMDWSDTLKLLRTGLEANLDRIFEKSEIPCLVVTHGQRIIGASALDMNPDAPFHLLSGPAILNEYRNRGLGSTLLLSSLLWLRKAGVSQARGLIKNNVLAAKFVYPKYNSTAEPHDYDPQQDGRG